MPTPTIIDTLTQLGQDLRDAVAACLGLRSDMQTIRDSTVTQTTTVINNFTSRPQIQSYYVDPLNGDDAADGLSLDKPLKTIDRCLQIRDQTVSNIVYLLGDVTMQRHYTAYSSLQFIGIVRGNGAFGAAFSYTVRKFSFLPEAGDSPVVGRGRSVPFFDMLGPLMRFSYVDVHMPAAAALLDQKSIIVSYGGQISFDNAPITVESADSSAVLIEGVGGSKSTVTFDGATIGPNVPGKLFKGVAAGGNPNGNLRFSTNITSA